MVRINIINPKYLADQHLIAEYDETLMLLGYVKRHKKIKILKNGLSEIPKKYTLGRGHILFFKNKLIYLKKRHELIKTEMKERNFKTNKTINLKGFKKELLNDWKPTKKDKEIIIERIKEKFMKKPDYYRYYREKHPISYFFILLDDAS